MFLLGGSGDNTRLLNGEQVWNRGVGLVDFNGSNGTDWFEYT